MTVRETVLARIREVLGTAAPECLNESQTFEELGADSLDLIELIMIIEAEYDHAFYLSDSDIVAFNHLRTVGDLVSLVERKTS